MLHEAGGNLETAPLIVRVPIDVIQTVAGLSADPLRELMSTLRAAWRRARHRRNGNIWMAGCEEGRDHACVDRAAALARHALGGKWGTPSARWAAAPAADPHDEANGTCPICLEDLTSPFPSPDGNSRAPEWLFACARHAACRGCDATLQIEALRRGHQLRCPLCRANRTTWVDSHYP